MTKLFVLGDFHGKISDSLLNRIRKENPDFILSPGDYCGNEKMRSIFFKYIHGKREEEIPERIQREYLRLEDFSFHGGVSVIKKLKKLNIPILSTYGNWDPTPYPFDLGGEVKETKRESFKKLIDEKFKLIDFTLIQEKDFILIGGASSSSPGMPTLKKLKKELKECSSIGEFAEVMLHFLRARKEYLRRKILYNRLFRKARRIAAKNKKPIIFLTHNCPYKTKLDLVKGKHYSGTHVGSYLERKLIEKFQPNIVLCGHIHESLGTDKIKKSEIINVGSASDGKFKILNI